MFKKTALKIFLLALSLLTVLFAFSACDAESGQITGLFQGIGDKVGISDLFDEIGEKLGITEKEDVNTYTVTWEDFDGTLLMTETVKEGEMPSYKGAEPQRAAEDKFFYTFSGWTPTFSPVNHDVTYKAHYTKNKKDNKSYTVAWKNYDGTVLKTDSLKTGDVPSYDGNTPTKPTDGETMFVFSGWDKPLSAVTGNATYTATFRAVSIFDVFIFDETKTVVMGLTDYGKTLTDIDIPEGVVEIADEAFAFDQDETLKSVTIPSSVRIIGEQAFSDCEGLKSVTFAKNSQCTIIGGGAFYCCHDLTSFTIPESVTSIGFAAFGECYGLSHITIPKNVEQIEELAFYFCPGLLDFTVDPGNTVYHSAGNCLIETASKTLIAGGCCGVIPDDGSVTSIAMGAFVFSSITHITIPACIKSIGEGAFSGCYKLIEVCNLSSLDIVAGSPDNGGVGYYAKRIITDEGDSFISSVGDYIFYEDGTDSFLLNYEDSETDLILPDVSPSGKTYKIYDYAFYFRTNVTSITMSSGVTAVGDNAFEGCWNLSAVYITDLAKWCGISFGNWGANPLEYAHYLYLNNVLITDLVIPEGVTSIGDYAFRDCTSLTSVTIPSSVKSIGAQAFCSCSSLTSITIPDRVTSIGDSAFEGCSGLTSITIPSSVTSIGYYAFSGCRGLTSITIPSSVTSIGSEAFYGCYKLIEVRNHSSLTITAGSSSNGDVGYYAKRIITDGSETYLSEEDGYLFYEDGTNSYLIGYKGTQTDLILPEKSPSGKNYEIYQYAFYYCSKLTSITIPSSVTSIGNYAFYDCSSLTSITIPSSVKGIGSYAFENCTNLTSVTIPDSVTSIGSYAFSRCSSLTSITIPSSVTSIGGYAFYGCPCIETVDGVSYVDTWVIGCDTALINVTLRDGTKGITMDAFWYCTRLTSITIPSSVTSIGTYAFSGCSGLTSITIPSSVTSIGDWAFYDCSGLASITFTGTKAQWNAISKGSRWIYNYNTSSYKIHCSDGDISK